MKVSVAIPCYNGEKYVKTCIESVLNQKRKADEILFIDDGSRDKSLQIAKSYPDVKILKHELNKGLAEARNTAVNSAIGDIIFFIDVDCEAHPDCLKNLVECYKKDSSIAGVGGGSVEIAHKGLANKFRLLFGGQGYIGNETKNAMFIAGLCSSYKKEILKKVGCFDPFFKKNAEDVDIGLRLKKLGYKIVYGPNIVVYHHREDNLKSLINQAYSGIYYASIAYFKNNYRPPWKHILKAFFVFPYESFVYITKGMKSKDIGILILTLLIPLSKFLAKVKASLDFMFMRKE